MTDRCFGVVCGPGARACSRRARAPLTSPARRRAKPSKPRSLGSSKKSNHSGTGMLDALANSAFARSRHLSAWLVAASLVVISLSMALIQAATREAGCRVSESRAPARYDAVAGKLCFSAGRNAR